MNGKLISVVLWLASCAAAFGAGWYVESLRWSASLLRTERAAVKQERGQQAVIEKQSVIYEKERADDTVQHVQRQETIRTVYRDRIVPADCAAPDDVVRVLAQAVTRANSRVGGEPGDGLPAAPATPDPADRPRTVALGRDDDHALRGLWLETQADGPGVADEQVSGPLPDPEFAMEYRP